MPYIRKIHMLQDPAFAREAAARETYGQVFLVSPNADADKRAAKKAKAARRIAEKITEGKARLVGHNEQIERIRRTFHDTFWKSVLEDFLAPHDEEDDSSNGDA